MIVCSALTTCIITNGIIINVILDKSVDSKYLGRYNAISSLNTSIIKLTSRNGDSMHEVCVCVYPTKDISYKETANMKQDEV